MVAASASPVTQAAGALRMKGGWVQLVCTICTEQGAEVYYQKHASLCFVQISYFLTNMSSVCHVPTNTVLFLPLAVRFFAVQPGGHRTPLQHAAAADPGHDWPLGGGAGQHPLRDGGAEPGVQDAAGHQNPPGAGDRSVPVTA